MGTSEGKDADGGANTSSGASVATAGKQLAVHGRIYSSVRRYLYQLIMYHLGNNGDNSNAVSGMNPARMLENAQEVGVV